MSDLPVLRISPLGSSADDLLGDEVLDCLERHFTDHAQHHWEDAREIIALMVRDLGFDDRAVVANIDEIVTTTTIILDHCMDVSPDLTTFRAWRKMHCELNFSLREKNVMVVSALWWPIAYACWRLAGQPDTAVCGEESAFAFISRGVTLSRAWLVVRSLLAEPNSKELELFLEMIASNGLLAEEMDSSAHALATMRQPDFPELVARWQLHWTDPERPSLKALRQRLAEERRHHRKRHGIPIVSASLKKTPIVIPPPNVQTAPLPPTAAPTTLDGVLALHLTGKAQTVADQAAAALRAMKHNNRPYQLGDLVERIERMTGGTGRTNARLIEDAMKTLARHGVVENKNGYCICETTDCPVGQKILSMV